MQFLNWITPNSVINRAAMWVKVGEKTQVTWEARWEINEQNEQAFRAALKIDHKFTDNFSAYLWCVADLWDPNIKPNLVVGGNVSWALGIFNKSKK